MILIRSAKVVDGTGKPPFTADVLVQGNRISAIGYLPSKRAETVIDGLGCYLVPGFIDVHTDSDHTLTLFTDSRQQDFLRRGVTTIIGGNCGSSLAPLLYGATLESIRKWTDTNQINVGWHSMADFLMVLGRQGLGVNFGTLVGHSTVRRAILGEMSRDLTDDEQSVFKNALARALTEGAFGLSTGLSYAHTRATPFREIEALAAVVRERRGLYATHVRDEAAGLAAAVREAIMVAERTGVTTIISHLRPFIGYEESFRAALSLVRQSKANVWFDLHPGEARVLPVYRLLPTWAQRGDLTTMFNQLLESSFANRIIHELPPMAAGDLTVVRAPGNEFLAGKTIGEIARSWGLTIAESILRIMVDTRLRSLVRHRNINAALAGETLFEERALVSSNSIHLEIGAFISFLESSAGRISFEQAVRKITAVPAELFRLADRGTIAEGKAADVVLIRDGADGLAVETVLVNGQLAVENKKSLGTLTGEIMKPVY